MRHLEHAVINANVVTQLEESYREHEYRDPDVVISSSMAQYIESLKIVPEHEREGMLVEWIKEQSEHHLTKWRSSYSQNDQLLAKALLEQTNLKNLKKQHRNLTSNLEQDLKNKDEEAVELKEQIKAAKENTIRDTAVDIKYERNKSYGMIILSLIVAFMTYIYFSESQITLKWSTMGDAQKASYVKQLIVLGDSDQRSAFHQYISENESGVITEADLSEIDESISSKSPVPSLSSYAKIDGTVYMWGMGALLLIMVGKLVAGWYEKIGMPKWMYAVLMSLALILVLASVVVMSSMRSLGVERTSQLNQLSPAQYQLDEYMDDVDAFEAEEVSEDQKRLEKKVEEVKAGIKELDKTIATNVFWMGLLAMLSEIMVSALAFCIYAEYISLKIKQGAGLGGLLDNLEKDLLTLQDERNQLNDKKLKLEGGISLASDLDFRISSLMNKIKPSEQLLLISQQVVQKEVSEAKACLQIAKSKWMNV